MKLMPFILRNLLRNKRRTLLTLVSVAVSLFIFAALMSMPEVVNRLLSDRVSSLRLVVYAKASYFYALPEAYASRIRAVPHVQAVMASSIFMGYYRSPDARHGAQHDRCGADRNRLELDASGRGAAPQHRRGAEDGRLSVAARD